MITKFKLFENENENDDPKFKVGDRVYIISQLEDKKSDKIYHSYEILKVIKKLHTIKNQYDSSLSNRYILDEYPQLTVKEESLISDTEVDAKKYNL